MLPSPFLPRSLGKKDIAPRVPAALLGLHAAGHYNIHMKKAGILRSVLIAAACAALILPGCGKKAAGSGEEAVVEYTIREILIPQEGERAFVVAWLRKSTGAGDVSFDVLAQRFWKWEGGQLTEIGREEYDSLSGTQGGKGQKTWLYSQHSVTVLSLDEEKGEAVVEVGSLYGPLAGKGVRYLLRREGNSWKKLSEETVWIS